MTQPQPFRLSASKLKRYLQCPRSYFLKYVQGVEEDVRGNYLVVGTAYDLHVQWYLSRGAQGVQSIDPRILRMFEAARRYLPEPGSVEVQFRYSVSYPDGFVVPHPEEFVVEGTPDLRRPGWLGDTKTTSAPGPGEGSAMTAEALREDIQFRLYAWCEFQLGWQGRHVDGTWSYVNKDTKPKAWNVYAQVWRSELEPWFDSVVRPAAAAMAKLHAEYDADRVVANLDSCERCWVRAACSPFDGPNSYDGVAGLIEPASLKRASLRPTLSANQGSSENMAYDLKQLSEDVDLTEALTASVRKVTETKQMVETVGETIQINPPPALRARPARKETPAESKLENLASELQTVVDTCQGAIARLDRMLAEIRGGQ